jgi:hypothetical protein
MSRLAELLARRVGARTSGRMAKYFTPLLRDDRARIRKPSEAHRPYGRRPDLAAPWLVCPRLLLPDGHAESAGPARFSEATGLSILR